MENYIEIADLIIRYREATINEHEQRQLDEWLAQSEENKELFNHLTDKSYRTILDTIDLDAEKREVFRLSREKIKWVMPVMPLDWRSVAAIIVVCVVLGAIGWKAFFGKSEATAVVNVGVDKRYLIQIKEPPPLYAYTPGKSKAVLSLDNGFKIGLDTAEDGLIGSVGNVDLVKLKNGHIEFAPNAGRTKKVIAAYNSRVTVYTPRGAQYQLTLSDGSSVWLNAATELKFPANLNEQERSVVLSGEAYFQVSKQRSPRDQTNKRFIVRVNEVKVYVIGTTFNIMSYKGEEVMKTTLKQGTVEITKGLEKEIITSGNQARIDSTGHISISKKVNVDDETAWKDKGVKLRNATLKQVLNQISRLYDVDIIVEKSTAAQDDLSVDIPGNTALPDALDAVRTISYLNYKYEGGKVKFSK